MKYRIFIIDTYYLAFLEDFYNSVSSNGEGFSLTYDSWKRTLLDKCFGTADFYSHALNKLGHEAREFIVNDEVGQKKWAAEQDIKLKNQYPLFRKIPKFSGFRERSWVYPILKKQIEEFQPNIIFNKNIGFISPSFLKEIKEEMEVKVVGQIASRLPEKKYFAPYDLVVSSLPHFVELFKNWELESEYLQLAFDPRVLEKTSLSNDVYDVTHIGGYGPVHNERNTLLEKVARDVEIDFWGYGTENLEKDSPILKNYHGQSWGLEMYTILRNSKITLTKHISKVADKYANNMSLYEATGCGCLLFTDTKKNLPNIFTPGKEIETYSSATELCEKIQFYLTHEDEREKIAKAGQERTLEGHTYDVRTRELVHIFDKILN